MWRPSGASATCACWTPIGAVFLVNGLPVLLVEIKAATRPDGLAEACDQIRRYHDEAPELMAVVQLHALTRLLRFLYGPTWNLSRKALFDWREEVGQDAILPSVRFEELVKSFVSPRRVLRALTEFILFTRTDQELTKAVLRPHQMRGVERVVARARSGDRRRGLIWHTPGSGKTYTMITAAQQLIRDPGLANPTLLMLVDRNELEAQLFGNLQSVGFGQVQVARSKHHLRELLASDQRGLIVSMIHKFEGMPADLNTRENMFSGRC